MFGSYQYGWGWHYYRQGTIGDILENQDIQMGSFLSDLYNKQQNRALSAAQGLQGLVGTKANIAQNHVHNIKNNIFSDNLSNHTDSLKYISFLVSIFFIFF